ncbi:MAG: hypothetical protein WCT28_02490 [Patescibacteria group bacterium]|jgi:hypothetical protein
MGTKEKRFDPSKFTVVFDRIEPGIGEIGVCIAGEWDLGSESFAVLDHELLTYTRASDQSLIIPIDDKKLAKEILTIAISFFFISEGDIVTSKEQPIRTDIDGTEIYTLKIPEYGKTEVEFAGAIDIDEVIYQLCFARRSNPLVIILEVTGTDPIAFREIDLKNRDLIEEITEAFLLEMGIGTPETEEEEECKSKKPGVSAWVPILDQEN